MARSSDVTSGAVISSTHMNALLDDYVSQTDTTDQNLASDIEVVAGKEIRADTISETTGAAGVTIDSVNLKDGNVELTTGVIARTCTPETLGAGVTTFAVTGEVMGFFF